MSKLSKAAEEFYDIDLKEARDKILDLRTDCLIDAHNAYIAIQAIEFMKNSKKHYRILRQVKISVFSLLAGVVSSFLIRYFLS